MAGGYGRDRGRREATLRSGSVSMSCQKGGRHQDLKVEKNVFDKTGEGEVGDPEVHADNGDRDDDDQGRRGNLLAIRPFDLLELANRLRSEAAEAAAPLTACTGLALRLANGLDLAPALAGPLACSPRLLEVGALAACAGLAGHYLVSLWRVCDPHQRQNFFVSKRSGVFRFDFCVW